MSDIGLIMNGLLGVLLVGALVLGWRLERRLKVLRASHESFTRAVEDLDRAAARAEQGLADLRAATDEAAETLAVRIERATQLAGQLARLTADAEMAETKLAAAPRMVAPRAEVSRAEPARREPVHAEPMLSEPVRAAPRAAPARETAFSRFAERYGAKSGHSPAVLAEAAARNDLILEDEIDAPVATSPFSARPASLAPEAAARIERLRALARTPATLAPKPARAADDELFDAPPLRAAGGMR
jgi:hypothetical protein